jgi:type IV secretory pathway VirB2 component (pilin)
MSTGLWRSAELLISSLLLILVALVFYYSREFPDIGYSMGGSPALYPRLLAVLLLVLAAITLLQGTRRPTVLAAPDWDNFLCVVAGAVMLFCAAIAMDYIGFRATAILVALMSMALLCEWRKTTTSDVAVMVATAVAGSFILHFIFQRLAGQPLPPGTWFLAF